MTAENNPNAPAVQSQQPPNGHLPNQPQALTVPMPQTAVTQAVPAYTYALVPQGAAGQTPAVGQPVTPVYVTATTVPMRPQQNGLAIASMVLGIISLVMTCVLFFFWPLGFVAAVVGLSLAIAASKKQRSRGMRVTGLVTSIITLSINLLVFLLFLLPLLLAAGAATTL